MSNRDWDQFDWRYTVTTSPTGIDTFVGCPRAWVFDKVWKLPRKPIDAGPLGECLHDVAQRYADADARGIDPKTGQEVDLYPKGWDAEVSATEAQLVQVLIKAAIDNGTLRRLPNAETELAFQYEAADGASVIGFGDYVTEDGYVDHKTTSNFKYNLTPAKLATNVQMLMGAVVVISRALKKGIKLDEVWLRHNYFLKDRANPKVKPIEVIVTADEVRKFWKETVLPVTSKMVDWKRRLKYESPAKWRDVPGATSPGICKKYKGCSFAAICGGKETTEEYVIRMNRQNAQRERAEKEKNDIMSDIFDTAKRRRKPVPPPEQPKAEPATTAITVGTGNAEDPEPTVANSTPPATVEGEIPPWAVADCIACKDNPTPGFNSKGDTPCRACDAARRRAKQPTSADYTLTFDDGVLIIEPGEGIDGPIVLVKFVGDATVAPAPPPTPAAETPKKDAAVAQAERKVEKATADAPETTPPVEAPAAKADAPAPEKPKAKTKKKTAGGRPRKGFTMVYGVQKRGRVKVIDLHQALLQYGNDLAKAVDAESYYDLDFGKRRDWLASRAEAIADTFGPAVVLVTGTDPDILAFANALEPFAADVFKGE